jgi:hypothetical protein
MDTEPGIIHQTHTVTAMAELSIRDPEEVSITTTTLGGRYMCPRGNLEIFYFKCAAILFLFALANSTFAVTDLEVADQVRAKNQEATKKIRLQIDDSLDNHFSKLKIIIEKISDLQYECENRISKNTEDFDQSIYFLFKEKIRSTKDAIDLKYRKILRKKQASKELADNFCSGNWQSNLNKYIDCQHKLFINVVILDHLRGAMEIQRRNELLSSSRGEVMECWRRNGVTRKQQDEMANSLDLESKLNDIYINLFVKHSDLYLD